MVIFGEKTALSVKLINYMKWYKLGMFIFTI